MFHIIKKIVLILFVFIIVTGFWIYMESNSSLGSPKEIMDFAKTYFVWFSNSFGNVKDFSGYAGKQDWKTETQNKTN